MKINIRFAGISFFRRAARVCLPFVCLLLATDTLRADTLYLFTDLGTLGGDYSYANGINDHGVIVGNSTTGDGLTHAFSASGILGPANDLGTLGGNYSSANAINNSGVIVGESKTKDGLVHAFVASGNLSAAGDLGTFGGASSYANAINNSGAIVGGSNGSSGHHAFVTTGVLGADLDPGTLGSPYSYANAINSSGAIVGASNAGAGSLRAFLIAGAAPGAASDLGTLGGANSYAHGINDAGLIVGESDVVGGGSHAFSATGILSAANDLGTLGGTHSSALAVNNSGVIVGQSKTGSGEDHAFVVRGGVMKDLNALVSGATPLNGFVLKRAKAINAGGSIVGCGTTSGGQTHAFLLTVAGAGDTPQTAWDKIGFTKAAYGAFDAARWPWIHHPSLGWAQVDEKPDKGGFWLTPWKSKIKKLWMSAGQLPRIYAYIDKKSPLKSGWFRFKLQDGKRFMFSYRTKSWIKDH